MENNFESIENLVQQAESLEETGTHENYKKAFEIWERVLSSDPNNVKALNQLGNLYSNGKGVEQNKEKALALYRKAAELDFCPSIYNLGYELHQKGDAECVCWYELAHQKGDIDATYWLATIFMEGKLVPQNIDQGVRYYEIGVEHNDAASMEDYGLYLINGAYGIPRNEERGMMLLKQVAEQGFPGKLNDAGKHYYYGDNGFNENKEKAFKCFIYAAECGNEAAMSNVGICYRNGYGTDIDQEKALYWFEKAGRQGYETALLNLEQMYKEKYGTEYDQHYSDILKEAFQNGSEDAGRRLFEYYYDAESSAHDIKLALEYMEAGIEREYAWAYYQKGRILAAGLDGFVVDQKTAIYYLEKAAEKDHRDAYIKLSGIYMGVSTEDGNKKVIQYLEKAAELDSGFACLLLGVIYNNGEHGCIEDAQKAFGYWRQGATLGNVECMEKVGLCYQKGQGVDQDYTEALKWYEKACEYDSPLAFHQMGAAYDTNGIANLDYQKALEYYQRGYELGNMMCASSLAILYQEGRGVEKNDEIAVQYLQEGADKEDAFSMMGLGFAYLEGRGVPKNVKRGLEYIEKANEAKIPGAERVLKLFYSDNKNFETNGILPERAFAFHMEYAQKGDAESQYWIGDAYSFGIGTNVDDRLALEWFERAAKQDYVHAQIKLGLYYKDGIGVEKNKALAQYWFEQAAAQGDLLAKKLLADVLSEEESTIQDWWRAEKLYQEVIAYKDENGYKDALFNLAYLYSMRLKDYDKAFPLWRELAEDGNSSAQYNLALSYYNGRGIQKNEHIAEYWFKKAADAGDEDAKEVVRMRDELRQAERELQELQKDRNTRSHQASQTSGGGKGFLIALGIIILVIVLISGGKNRNGGYNSGGENIQQNELSYSEEQVSTTDYLPNGDEDPEWFYYDLDTRYITEEELYEFSETQLVYIRNSIYAMEGRQFKDSDLREYFEGKTWYNPNDLSDQELVQNMNDYQRKNLDVIVCYEDN